MKDIIGSVATVVVSLVGCFLLIQLNPPTISPMIQKMLEEDQQGNLKTQTALWEKVITLQRENTEQGLLLQAHETAIAELQQQLKPQPIEMTEEKKEEKPQLEKQTSDPIFDFLEEK